MKKRIILFICVMTLCLSACAKATVRTEHYEETVNDSSVEVSYELLNGERIYKAVLKEDSAISVNINTFAGELQLEIKAEGKQPDYTGRIRDNSSFNVNLHAGEYTILLVGNKHSGNISLAW